MDPLFDSALDPELVDLVRSLPHDDDGAGDAGDPEDIAALRDGFRALALPLDPSLRARLEIRDESVGEVLVRIYRPAGAAAGLAGLLLIHGGGFVMGDIETEHVTAAQLADDLGVIVASVDYRLAPEHPAPAALLDCYRALEHLATLPGVDPARIAVHGSSAGGALAAGVALMARDRDGPALLLQSLHMPVLDDRLRTASMRRFVDTPMWNRRKAERSWRLYLGGGTADGYIAPARTADLRGLPPTYLVTAGLDPLRDEGAEYARRLTAAGVLVEYHHFPRLPHGASLAAEATTVQRMDAELRAVLAEAFRR